MKYNRGGLIMDIIIVVVILIVLGYFGININNVIHSPTVQSNLGWFGQVLTTIWGWISGPITWLWNTFVVGVLWHGIQAGVHTAATSTTP
ncbi:MAG: hypothetical protein KGH93_01900 [Patescibacteria group bacterium]|nr:hypothetical protein [Patescibacteria group bacterium]MDE1945931.1 hypothetical protein [Patescibacteria group bacterium]